MMNRLPGWLHNKQKNNPNIRETKKILNSLQLESVCQNARCPNMNECFSKKIATFMILGDICTRDCAFCAVKHGQPEKIDTQEAEKLLQAVKKLSLNHVVITSVTRDDLTDGGAEQFYKCIKAIKGFKSEIIVEVLTPDFNFAKKALQKIAAGKPDIYNHNLETVPRLYSQIRPQAEYQRSLAVLKYMKKLNDKIYTKSGIMIGLGEKEKEVFQVMQDLKKVDCDILTIGQYLQPTRKHPRVVEYLPPEYFDQLKQIGEEIGFKYVAAGPLVRSSYLAEETGKKLKGSEAIG